MESSNKEKRSFLGVMFECCSIYARIYRKVDQEVYEGCCPKCRRTLRVAVDPVKGVPVKFLRAR